MKITIKNPTTGEICTIVRDVCHQHPAWVHEHFGSSSEGELQAGLDSLHVSMWYRNGHHLGRDSYGLSMELEQDEMPIRISDGNATEWADTREEAAEIISGWYDYLLDDGKVAELPDADLDDSTDDALCDSVQRWESRIAKAMGSSDFDGHGRYHVSAADRAGLALSIRREVR